jgi:hypothetical protein
MRVATDEIVVRDRQGAVKVGATGIEITDEATMLPAPLYTDDTGSTTVDQATLTTDQDGYIVQPGGDPAFAERGHVYLVKATGTRRIHWDAASGTVSSVMGRVGDVSGLAEATAVYVDDQVFAVGDDAKLTAAATQAGTDRQIVLSDRDYNIGSYHALSSLPVGQGVEKTRVIATSAAAGIQVGGLVGGAIQATGTGGGFTFDGAGIADPPLAAIVLNTVNGSFGPIGVTNVKGHLLAILGQNNEFLHPNVGGASDGGSGYYFDNGAGGNHLVNPRASNCADVHCLFTQTATSSSGAYPVPEDNIIDHPIFEQQSLSWGNGNGSVRNEAGAWNVIRDPNCFSQYGSIFKITKNPNSGRSADLSGRLIIEGRIEATGGGAAHGQAAFEVNAVSGGVAGALTGDAGFVFIGTEFETAGVETVWRYGSTTPSISIGGDWTRYPFSETWWETNGTGALAGLAGYMLNQGQSSIGIGMLPGGTLSIEAAGGIGANLNDAANTYIRLINNGGDAPEIVMGPGSGWGNAGDVDLVHIHDQLALIGAMLGLGRIGITHLADALGTALGDKLALYGGAASTRWGIGLQSGVGVLYGASGGRYSFRETATSGQASAGSGALLPVEAADPVNTQDLVTKGFLATQTGLLVPLTYLDTDGTLAANSDTKIATQKATKTAIAAAKAAVAGAYRSRLATGTRLSTAATSTASPVYLLIPNVSDTTTISATLAGATFPWYMELLAAMEAMAGLTAKLILEPWVAVAGTAPAITYTFGLYKIVITTGSYVVSGAAVAGSTSQVASPGANAVTLASAGASPPADFSLPADGAYAVGVVLSGATNPAANTNVGATVKARNV